MKVTDTDRGFKKYVERLATLRKGSVSVGITEASGAASDGEITVLEVAIYNEFGTSRIPARPFVRGWFDANETRARAMLVQMMKAVEQGKYTKAQALELLGQKFAGEIQAMISAGVPPPNAASTIAKKGSSKPLIDTGQLRSAITYRVDSDK